MILNKAGVTAFTDTPFGDCGKGARAAFILMLYAQQLASSIPLIGLRWQGSSNSGHTVPYGTKLVDVHALPGSLVPSSDRFIMSVMGRDMAFSLPRLFEEIAHLESFGIKVTSDNLLISQGAKLTLPYQRALDGAREAGVGKSGTTKQGVAFTYGFATMYEGIRIGDIVDMNYVSERLKTPLGWANSILTNFYGQDAITLDEVLEEILEYRERILPFLGDERQFLNKALEDGARIIAEGAQSLGLDRDQGCYPHVTGSNTLAGSLQTGAGIHFSWIDEHYLVFKAYDTSVGTRPLIGRMPRELEKEVQKRGSETGVSSGRPRECMYASLPWHNLANTVVRPTHLVLNKGDVVTGLPMKICVGYELDGHRINHVPTSILEFQRCKSILEEQPIWTEDFNGATDLADIPSEYRDFAAKLCAPYDAPLALMGTGRYHKDVIVLN